MLKNFQSIALITTKRLRFLINSCAEILQSQSVLLAGIPIIFAGWLWIYLMVPFPSIFGDEFSMYAVTKQAFDKSYNLIDQKWIYDLSGSMSTYSTLFKYVHLRSGSTLAAAQFLNALVLCLSLPVVWFTANKFVSKRAAGLFTLAYATMGPHLLGSFFVLEPFFLLFFWLTILATLQSIEHPRFALLAGMLCCAFFYIKPHALITIVWSLGFLITIAIHRWRVSGKFRSALTVVLWMLGLILYYAGNRVLNGQLATNTIRGDGFYGNVLNEFINPTLLWSHLGNSLTIAVRHFSFYGSIFGISIGLALFGVYSMLNPKRRLRPIDHYDIAAISFIFVALALFLMSVAFTDYVREPHRVHGRYWSYSLFLITLCGFHFWQRPLSLIPYFIRILPAGITVAALFCLYNLPAGLQITPNDCPEVHWIYLSVWRPGQLNLWTKIILAAILVVSMFPLLIRDTNRLIGVVAVSIIVVGTISCLRGTDWLVDNSNKNSSQAVLAAILRSREGPGGQILIIAPKQSMTGGLAFGLRKIPDILELEYRSTVPTDSIPAPVEFIATVGEYIVPENFNLIWSMDGYCLYVAEKLSAK